MTISEIIDKIGSGESFTLDGSKDVTTYYDAGEGPDEDIYDNLGYFIIREDGMKCTSTSLDLDPYELSSNKWEILK